MRRYTFGSLIRMLFLDTYWHIVFSNETDVLKVVFDVSTAMDRRQITLLGIYMTLVLHSKR